ncbi:MAG: DUF6364 family protein [Verrucomicrobia bacterium]|nr:DUF6364 family protein [Verrucomicrobiota bacterium]
MREKTNLTLHPAVKESALALARSQGRSLSELVERLLEREVEKTSSPTYAGMMREDSLEGVTEYLDTPRAKVTYQANPRSYKQKASVKI